MAEILGIAVGILTTLTLAFGMVGIGVRYVLLPWLREHLVEPVEETRAKVEYELEVNGGSSIKDEVRGIAVAVGVLGVYLDQLSDSFDGHCTEAATYMERVDAHLSESDSK